MCFKLICIISMTIVFQCIHSTPISMENDFISDTYSTMSPDDFDCLLWMTKKYAHLMPNAYEIYGNQSQIKPDRHGFMNIKHNFNFTISCKPRKFVDTSMSKTGEVHVTCYKTVLVYKRKKHLYEDFKCDGPMR